MHLAASKPKHHLNVSKLSHHKTALVLIFSFFCISNSVEVTTRVVEFNVTEGMPSDELIFDPEEEDTLFACVDEFNLLFDLRGSTKSIYTNRVIDREVVAERISLPNDPIVFTCEYLIEGTPAEIIQVIINLIDDNDNRPTFRGIVDGSKTYNQNEYLVGSPKSISIDLPLVVDYDEGLHSTQRFTMTRENHPGLFTLTTEDRGGAEYRATLTSTRIIDREMFERYEAVVTAYDGGSPPLNSSLMVHINFLDINDNIPVFPQSRYNITAPEDSEAGHFILDLNATDIDPDSGSLEYSIDEHYYYFLPFRPGNTLHPITEDDHWFNIDPATGRLTTSRQLNREAYDNHPIGFFLEIVAHDGEFPGKTTVTVYMDDINDNAPIITPSLVYSTVQENFASFPLRLGSVKISDPDAGINGSYTTFVRDTTTEEQSRLFYLENSDGTGNGYGEVDFSLFLNSPVDYEEEQEYHITIVAVDHGSPSLTSSFDLTISVGNVDDNPPLFIGGPYFSTVVEGRADADVIQVQIEDADGDAYTTNDFSLPPSVDYPYQDHFVINVGTGVIRTRVALDREELEGDNSISLLVKVQSKDIYNQFCNTTVVTITVLDVNDNPPVFQQGTPTSASVKENQTVGMHIVTVTATDADEGTSKNIVYSIEPRNSVPFSIDQDGLVKTTARLDREKEPPASYTFNILASDGVNSSSLPFTVHIVDINDNPPSFARLFYSRSLSEAVKVGSSVIDLTVSDVDLNSQFHYSFVSGNDLGHFSILDNGTIILIAILDRERWPTYSLVATVHDGQFSSINRATVNITVLDISDSPPLFDLPRYTFAIRENLQSNSIFGLVRATSEDQEHNGLKYSIEPGDSHFIVTTHSNGSGILTAVKSLDREEVEVYNLTMVATTTGQVVISEGVPLTIKVLDENDNGPVFPMTEMTIDISESFPVGSVLFTAAALDVDLPENIDHSYSLSGQLGGNFNVDPQTGEVRLESPLTFESPTTVWFSVVATDGTHDATTLRVNINVTETHENAPNFPDNFPHQIQIEEEAKSVQLIYTFTISDPDSSSDAVSVAVHNTDGLASSYFHITQNGQTAKLYTSMSLDREEIDTHNLRITLTDSDGHFSQFNLDIIVLDINDNHPVFHNQEYDFEILENQQIGVLVGRVVASDADIGENASILYSLHSPSNYFSIDETNGDITTTAILDREMDPTFSLKVIARDQGIPNSQERIVQVSIRVLDEDDNAPVFDPFASYSILVHENVPPGHVITRIVTTDRDEGSNAEIALSILDPYYAAGPFEIFGNNLIVSGKIDYESQTRYILHIQALDGGGLLSTKVFNITLGNVNDEFPIFAEGSFSATINEDIPRGTTVGVVRATDRDNGQGGIVTFTLGKGNFKESFDISDDGVITTAKLLDFEEKEMFELEVIATDTGSPSLSNVHAFTVNLVDVNDNFPRFPTNSISGQISENAGEGTSVMEITATDKDRLDSGKLVYSILQQIPHGDFFTINSESGEISVAGTLDYETHTNHILLVQVMDEAGHTNATFVIIYLGNADDNKPVFRPPLPTDLNVPENYPTGQPIATISAIDPDNPIYSSVDLALDGDFVAFFTIDSAHFHLELASSLNAEEHQTMTVTVRATDKVSQQSTEEVITIHVLDVNDNDPLFTSVLNTFSIQENSLLGSEVGGVTADDYDVTFNTITYKLDPPSSNFTIDSNTGIIKSQIVFDFEALAEDEKMYKLTVVASDNALERRSVSTTVTVEVTDANDHEPIFAEFKYYKNINQAATAGSNIATVTAEDEDTGLHGQLRYTLEGNSYFSVRESSGQIYLTRQFDGNQQSTYELNLTATDNSHPFHTTTVTVVMSLITAGDKPPQFSQSTYIFSIKENSQSGITVGSISASDDDVGSNGIITYSLLPQISLFSVSSNGNLILEESPDREVESSYVFFVIARDGSGRSISAQVIVNITDENDLTPQFVNLQQDIRLTPVPGTNYLLFTLQVVDDDEGENGTVTFSVSPLNIPIQVDPSNGEVRTKEALTEGTNFEATFGIQDGAISSPRSNSAIVSFSVVDTSEIIPQFGLDSPHSVYVSESAEVGSVVHTFSASSHLLSDPPRTYTVVHSNAPKGLFKVIPSTGDLVLLDELDYENVTSYSFTVEARQEVGLKWLSDYLDVVIEVEDENDNDPIFVQPVISPISESETKGTVLFQVTAIDRDTGDAGRVQYSIKNQSYIPALRIHSQTGQVTVDSGLDAERSNTFNLVVQAKDKGRNPHSSLLSIVFEVLDENDNRPIFHGNDYVSLAEDSSLNTLVYIAHANDSDVSSNLLYSIVSENAYYEDEPVTQTANTFVITNPASGEVLLSNELNREIVDKYVLTVRVNDSDMYFADVKVTINVADVNDNPPKFRETELHFSIYEQLAAGSSVFKVAATDEDISSNGEIHYHISDSANLFAINERTGEVTLVSAAPDFDLTSTNEISGAVTASDRGSPQKSSQVLIFVAIIDVNDHPPAFGQSTYEFLIFDNLTVGHPLSPLVAATDSMDSDNNNRIAYRIDPVDKVAGQMFQIDNNGRLTVRSTLVPQEYMFEVQAWNDFPVPYLPEYVLYSTTMVTIRVNHMNEFPPIFSKSQYSVVLSEDTPPDTIILTFLATDQDYGIAGELEYYFTENALPFSVTATPLGGVVKTSAELDRETATKYEITLLARDRGEPQKSSSVTIHMTLLDVNDNKPTFASPTSVGYVKENSAISTSVIKVSASDPDEGSNGTIRYSIINSNSNPAPFAINENSGLITSTSDSLDRETVDQYLINVSAVDLGKPSLSSFLALTIIIEDVNEHRPSFRKSSYEYVIGSGKNKEDVVGFVKALDEDRNPLFYQFVDDVSTRFFIINETTGDIILIAEKMESSSVVTEEYRTINAIVEVRDHMVANLAFTARVNVTLELSTVFSPVETPTTTPTVDLELWIVIIIGLLGGTSALVCFVVITVIAVLCYYRKKGSYAVKDRSDNSSTHSKNNQEFTPWDRYTLNSDSNAFLHNFGDNSIEGGMTNGTLSASENTVMKQSRTSLARGIQDSPHKYRPGMEMGALRYKDSPNKYSHSSSTDRLRQMQGTQSSMRSTSDLGNTVNADYQREEGVMMDTGFTGSNTMMEGTLMGRAPDNISHHSTHMFEEMGGGEGNATDYNLSQKRWESDDDSVKGFEIEEYGDLRSRSSGMLLQSSGLTLDDGFSWRRSKESDLFRSQTMDVAVDEMTSGAEEPTWQPNTIHHQPTKRSHSSQGHYGHHGRQVGYYKQRSHGPKLGGSSLSMQYQGADGYYRPPAYSSGKMRPARSSGGIYPRKPSSVISEPYQYKGGYSSSGRHSSMSGQSYLHYHRGSSGYGYNHGNMHHSRNHVYGNDVPTQSTHIDSLSQPSISPMDEFEAALSYGPEPASSFKSSSSSVSVASTQISNSIQPLDNRLADNN